MAEGRSWKTNDPYSAGVAAALSAIERDMSWVRGALNDGKESFRLHSQAIDELKGIARDLSNAVKLLIEEGEEAQTLKERVRALENEAALNREAMERWRRIHDTFLVTMVKWLLTTALTAAAGAIAAVKATR